MLRDVLPIAKCNELKVKWSNNILNSVERSIKLKKIKLSNSNLIS